MLTVDVPVAGNRLRDARNGFSIPPTLTMKTIADIATHPAWWANLLYDPAVDIRVARSVGSHDRRVDRSALRSHHDNG